MRTGTYAVLLVPQQQGPIQIGRLGPLTLNGSKRSSSTSAVSSDPVAWLHAVVIITASPPGRTGIWTFCVLRCDLTGVWVDYGHERLERRWAQALGALPGARVTVAVQRI